MNALKETVFICEIVQQAKVAGWAAKHLPKSTDDFDSLEVWCSIQLILVAAGNVSKILWPGKKYSSRGKALRQLLNVNDESPLSNRNLRNHFEHYDERIEKWFKKTSSSGYTDLVISPFKPIFGNHAVEHRVYNPLTQTLKFRGESLDLKVLLNSLEEIRDKCRPF